MRQRKQLRLKNYDYSSYGMYFVTIRIKDRSNLFGEIVDGVMVLNEWGKIVETTWFDLINHNSNISLDCFVVMPDHVHGIINIVGAGSKPAPNGLRAGLEPAPTKLSEIIRQFKTFSAKRINKIRNTLGVPIW